MTLQVEYMKNTTITREQLMTVINPYTYGDNNENLIVACIPRSVYDKINGEPLFFADGMKNDNIVDIINITVSGVTATESHFYDGTQTVADKMLLDSYPKWTKKHICKGVPYVSLMATYNDCVKNFNGKLIIEGDVIREYG